MTEHPSVGFVGFGEAASTLASGLAAAGLDEIRVFCEGARNRPPYTPEFRASIEAAGATAVDSLAELVTSSDVVFSAVLVGSAETVGLAIAEHLRAGQLVVDVNACPPAPKRAVAAAVEARGGQYVDANLMGAVSIYGPAVQLYCSGSGASRFQKEFTPLGLTVDDAGDEAGVSATVKMLRSVVTKGTEALFIEAMLVAQRAGIPTEAFDGICAPMDATTYSAFAEMVIKTDVLHSERRAVEMRQVAEALGEFGIDPMMTTAAAQRLQASADLGLRDHFLANPPRDYHDVLEAYDQRLRTTAPTEG